MTDPLRLLIDEIATPIGKLSIVDDEAGHLCIVEWSDHRQAMQRALKRLGRGRKVELAPARDRFGHATSLRTYFSGRLDAIDALPVVEAGTDFQNKVWRALRRIPCGKTLSYAGLARRIGHPTAVRAVGLANGSNPISIVVPCHRVIGTDGTLTGYGGGIERKQWLLAHEGCVEAR
ncbi:MAG: methylated-DNA--[protein]-cysteine S-methyltransferase [Alphaproteobacteria bacterium]|nr:methylated-DNA--[protein]-cysteine S-methyltransferase [Alphaproteobacteria bacterium]